MKSAAGAASPILPRLARRQANSRLSAAPPGEGEPRAAGRWAGEGGGEGLLPGRTGAVRGGAVRPPPLFADRGLSVPSQMKAERVVLVLRGDWAGGCPGRRPGPRLWREASWGIQGSLLGPALFHTLVKDIGEQIRRTHKTGGRDC